MAKPLEEMSRHELIEHWTPLAMAGCARFKRTTIPREDREQESMLALILAIDGYKPSKGDFGHYARICINHRLQIMCGNQMRPMRVPSYLNQAASKIAKARKTLGARGDWSPSLETLAALTGICMWRVQAVASLKWHRVVDDDLPESPLYDDLPDAMAEMLAAGLAAVWPAERTLVERRFGLCGEPPVSYVALGAEMGISVAKTRFRVKWAVDAVRKAIRTMGYHEI